MTDRDPAGPLPLDRLIRNAAREVSRLNGPLAELETTAIGTGAGALHDRESRARLQAFDRLSQHVVALSAFLDRLSHAVPEELEVDALSIIAAIPLEEIRDGLSAGLAAEPNAATPCSRAAPDASPGGVVDLF